MPKRSDMDHGLLLLIVAVLAWVIPGAGHFFIKEKKRAMIIFVTITATFTVGLYIGSIAVIDRVGAWPWYVGQMLTSPSVAILAQTTQNSTKQWHQEKQQAENTALIAAKLNSEAIRATKIANQQGSSDSIKKAQELNQKAKKAMQESALLQEQTQQAEFVSYGKPHDIGQIYTAIAGAMNLLAILSAVYMAHSGRGEMIGSEEDE
jgi:hypothetical protein